LKLEDRSGWSRELAGIVPQLGRRVGESYQNLVAWCLGLRGGYTLEDYEFVERVLDPLEDIVNAISL
jgi:hypothetical protein